MIVIENMQEWRNVRRELGKNSLELGKKNVGFVPTMGALHEGHVSLLRESVAQEDVTVLSIYVNPTQFNDPKDLANYPDTLTDDLDKAREVGVDYVILPKYEDIYSDGFRYQVTESEFSLELCGANRPGHFTGVLTVVMKLLNLVKPDRAYFGKKDYQQYQLISDMCEAFFMDVEIVPCETVRETDGLAMSSRNKLLDHDARALARHFNKILVRACDDEHAIQQLEAKGFKVDYVETRGSQRFGAVVVNSGDKVVRLIDNVALPKSAGPTVKDLTRVSAG